MNFKMNYNSFDLCNTPTITLCKPSTEIIAIVNGISDLNITPKFNAISEMTFKVNNHSDENSTYKLLKAKKQLLVEDIGYFSITNVETVEEGNIEYKNITATSCESDLADVDIPYIKGTYQFSKPTLPYAEDTIFGIILNKLTNWKLGTIDKNVAERFRTFDVPQGNIYNFMLTDLEESFECIFEFDTMAREISVLDKKTFSTLNPKQTSIIISSEDVVDNLTINESFEESATVLKVSGGNGLKISSVNPMGTDQIINFDYYLTEEWMSVGTITAINSWKEKCKAYSVSGGIYAKKKAAYDAKRHEITKATSQRVVLKNDLNNYEAQKVDIIVAGGDLHNINTSIDNKKKEIIAKDKEIKALETALDVIRKEIENISDDLSLGSTSNFTLAQQKELSYYIYTSEFKDETIARTENLDYNTEQERALELYNKAVMALAKVHEPKYTYDVNTGGFIFNKYFKKATDQLQTGCLIDVVVGNAGSTPEVVTLILLSFDVNYEEFTCKFSFGNRYRNKDPMSLYDDFYSSSSKAENTIEWNKDFWQTTANAMPDVVRFTKDSLNLAKNAVLSADGQSIQIDDNGYWGRRLDGDVVEEEQLRIINNMIAFSDDGFASAKTAIGKIKLPEGIMIDGKNYVYGIAAEYLSGDLIVGGKLNIQAKNGENQVLTTIDENGLTIKNGAIKVLDNDGDKLFYVNNDNVVTSNSSNTFHTSIGSIVHPSEDNVVRDSFNIWTGDGDTESKPFLSFWKDNKGYARIEGKDHLTLSTYAFASGEYTRSSLDIDGSQNQLSLCCNFGQLVFARNSIELKKWTLQGTGVAKGDPKLYMDDEWVDLSHMDRVSLSVMEGSRFNADHDNTDLYGGGYGSGRQGRLHLDDENCKLTCGDGSRGLQISQGSSIFQYNNDTRLYLDGNQANLNYKDNIYLYLDDGIAVLKYYDKQLICDNEGVWWAANGWKYNFANYTYNSDVSLKHDIKDTKIHSLDIIKQIQHREFRWNDTDNFVNVGYIAQELNVIDPDFTIESTPIDKSSKAVPLLQIDQRRLLPHITKAIQELHEFIEDQQDQINDLNNQIISQNQKFDDMQKQIGELKALILA